MRLDRSIEPLFVISIAVRAEVHWNGIVRKRVTDRRRNESVVE
jgi:hypothetical protein